MNTLTREDHRLSKAIFAKDYGKWANYFFYLCSTVFMEETAAVVLISTYWMFG